MDRSPPSARLPFAALSLAARSFLPLAFFYTAGRVLHDLILVGAVYAGDVEAPRKYLGFAVMSLAVLATLAGYVAMLQVLRPPDVRPAGTAREGRLTTVMAHTLLPFLAFYGAWGLFTDDVRQYSILSQELFGVQEVKNLEFDPLLTTGAIAAVAFAVRVVFEKAYERSPKAWLGLATTVFESLWMFFAVVSIEVFISDRVDWLTSRAAWVGAREFAGALLEPVSAVVGAVLPSPKDALLLPLVWLTIAAVVFGRDMAAGDAVIAGTRAEPKLTLLRTAAPDPVRNAVEFLSRDLRGKYTPVLNGIRLALGGGVTFILTFCLLYVLLTAARDWAFIGVTHLVGPQESNWWTLWHGPLKFGVTAVYEVLRISLLAAAFQLIVGRGPAAGSRPPATAVPRSAGS